MVERLEPLLDEIPNDILKEGYKTDFSSYNKENGCIISCDQPCYDSPDPCFVMNCR